MFAQQINGIQFFYSYGVVFAESIGVAQPFTISVITNVLQVVAVLVSVLLGNRIGRRIIYCRSLALSTIGNSIERLHYVGLDKMGGGDNQLNESNWQVICPLKEPVNEA